jgi:CDP-2,3-bis-(O-geranylgeranyl)-sn-glycerol synthase
LVGLGCKIGALVGSAAMSGDLFSSFLKRRIGLPVSSRVVGLDQVPESLFPLLACRSALSLTVWDIAVTVLAFFFVTARLVVRGQPKSAGNGTRRKKS